MNFSSDILCVFNGFRSRDSRGLYIGKRIVNVLEDTRYYGAEGSAKDL